MQLTKDEAIQTVQSANPELAGYPSDGLPPKSIATEEGDGGWYVAFVQEGSGRPIISAACYFVDEAKEVKVLGEYAPHAGDSTSGTFSPKTCSLKQ